MRGSAHSGNGKRRVARTSPGSRRCRTTSHTPRTASCTAHTQTSRSRHTAHSCGGPAGPDRVGTRCKEPVDLIAPAHTKACTTTKRVSVTKPTCTQAALAGPTHIPRAQTAPQQARLGARHSQQRMHRALHTAQWRTSWAPPPRHCTPTRARWARVKHAITAPKQQEVSEGATSTHL